MKKIFTIFSLLSCACVAHAQNTVDVSTLLTSKSTWSGSDSFDGANATLTGDNGAAGYASWSVVAGVSNFATVTAQISNVTGDIAKAKIYLQYCEDLAAAPKNLKDLFSAEVAIADGSATIRLPLDPAYSSWAVTQVMIQCDKPGSFVVDKFFFTESAEWNLAGSLEGNCNWISKDYFATLPDDARVVFTYNAERIASEGSDIGWVVGKIHGAGEGESDANKNDFCQVKNDGLNTAELTAADLKTILDNSTNQWGISWTVWNTNNHKISRVKVEFFTKGSTALRPLSSTAEVVATEFYSLSGAKLSAPRRGLNIVVRTLSDGSRQTDKILVE
ncbi:MAG: hypothetical protein II375_09605 [Bacteroidales bacterium]|nr:hypothetical protein [Bacteroidales bacterium]